MKALILNSGTGKRMGFLTSEHPKCMTEISKNETILSRQLTQLANLGISEIVITTGFFDQVLIDYVNSLNLNVKYTFVNNPIYDTTNYIYSIYLAKEYLNDDILLMHGDLVFEEKVLNRVFNSLTSCMTISSTLELPLKDFKAVLKNKLIEKIGIDFFDNAVSAQPLYKLLNKDWIVWLTEINNYCENDNVSCYAENAFNDVSHKCKLYPYDVKDDLCLEIDTPEDLELIKKRLTKLI